MQKRSFAAIIIWLMSMMLLAGCGAAESSNTDKAESVKEEAEEKSSDSDEAGEDQSGEKSEKKEDPSGEKSGKETDGSGGKSLAQRMAGKYSYEDIDEDGNSEFLIMDVVPFGDNLYAFCGKSMPENDENLEAYTFWACEFIPYDEDEMTSTDGDTVTVNELCFSVMSNAGKYWNAGYKGTVTLTDDGLVFKGFDHDGFLVPDNEDSRLFLKDDRVEDTFGYLKRNDQGGDDDLQGLWVLDSKGADLYLEFTGSDLYIYRKDPSKEVFYAAGGYDHSDGSFEYSASCLGNGGMPLELSCDYKVSGDKLTLKPTGTDIPEGMPENGKYKRVKDGKVHVTTMDEVKFDSESFGSYGYDQDNEEPASQDYYGVFVSSSKDQDKCASVIEKLEKAGFTGSLVVYTPDFSGLNPEPYYVAATGLYASESDAEEALSKVKDAGFADAYMKHAGSYIGEESWNTRYGDSIE